MSDSLQPHRLEPTRLLCPWNFLGKNTGVDFLLQEIFPTQGSNPHLLYLLHWQVDSLLLTPPGKNFSIICNILTFFHSFHSSNLSVDYYEFSTFTRMSIVCVCVCVKSLICIQPFAILWTVACQAPLSVEFSRQEYWSVLPWLLQGIFPIQGSNPGLPHYGQIIYRLSYVECPQSYIRTLFSFCHFFLGESLQ